MKTHTKKFLTLIISAAFLGCGDVNTNNVETTGSPYPLDTCIVSDKKLGSMGDPMVIDHEGQQVKFCCSPCIDDFKKDQAKFLAKIKK